MPIEVSEMVSDFRVRVDVFERFVRFKLEEFAELIKRCRPPTEYRVLARTGREEE